MRKLFIFCLLLSFPLHCFHFFTGKIITSNPNWCFTRAIDNDVEQFIKNDGWRMEFYFIYK